MKRYFFDVVVESYIGEQAKYAIYVIAKNSTTAMLKAEEYSYSNMGLNPDDRVVKITQTGVVDTNVKHEKSFMEELREIA